jgi:hypothetical protein
VQSVPTFAQYASLSFLSVTSCLFSKPGSFPYGSFDIRLCIDHSIDSKPCADDHSSPGCSPCHVPSIDRHTLPPAYMLGLNRHLPLLVVLASTLGGLLGYSAPNLIANWKKPYSYGEPGVPIIKARTCRTSDSCAATAIAVVVSNTICEVDVTSVRYTEVIPFLDLGDFL